MEVNNYQSFCFYLRSGPKGYSDLPLLLFYKQKKPDLLEEDYTGFKKIEIVQSYTEINMTDILQTCNENKCRCYVMVMDKLFLKVASKIALTSEKILEFLDYEVDSQKGLHLIDIDDPHQCNGIMDRITELGGKNLQLFDSRSGLSLVFYGKSEIVKKYNDSLLEDNPNRGHLICALNLYVPML